MQRAEHVATQLLLRRRELVLVFLHHPLRTGLVLGPPLRQLIEQVWPSLTLVGIQRLTVSMIPQPQPAADRAVVAQGCPTPRTSHAAAPWRAIDPMIASNRFCREISLDGSRHDGFG